MVNSTMFSFREILDRLIHLIVIGAVHSLQTPIYKSSRLADCFRTTSLQGLHIRVSKLYYLTPDKSYLYRPAVEVQELSLSLVDAAVTVSSWSETDVKSTLSNTHCSDGQIGPKWHL